MAPIELPIQNMLLRGLSEEDFGWLGALEQVSLSLRDVLEVANTPSQYTYFIEDGLASVVSGDGSTEVGVIGREGVTGIGVAYGDSQLPFGTFMQVPGSAMRCETAHLQRALSQSESLRTVFAKYARAFAIQVAATAIANGRSKLEERLARWLLMVSDRTGSTFSITHEFMAMMLAVRRSGVTLAIQSLEGRGLIRAGRGAIHIIDRRGLVLMSGGSYGLPEREYVRLLGDG